MFSNEDISAVKLQITPIHSGKQPALLSKPTYLRQLWIDLRFWSISQKTKPIHHFLWQCMEVISKL